MDTRRARCFAAWMALAGASAVSCTPEDAAAPARSNPVISDAVHSGGTQGFYFLPPLVPAAAYGGAFEASVRPTVQIWALDAGGRPASLLRSTAGQDAVYTMTSGQGSEVIRVDPTDQNYIVNWHTDGFALNPNVMYRIRVFVPTRTIVPGTWNTPAHVEVNPTGREIGYADVDVVSSGSQLRNVATNEYVALLNGRTLPIKFRIEHNAVDGDRDTVLDDRDNCPATPNPDQADHVGNGVGDACRCETASINCNDSRDCTADSCAAATGCVNDAAAMLNTVCRAAAGVCDVADRCDGTAPVCPTDAKVAAGTECRASAGVCDLAEACDGSSNACPADAKVAAGTECRAAAGICDVAEVCNGSSNACPDNAFAAATTVCRASAGDCDMTETCTGSSAACPDDRFVPSTVTCRAAAGVCDAAERCTGSTAACPGDAKVAAGTECRGVAGVCDVAEACDGAANDCPADLFLGASVQCREAAGICDVAENCTGGSAACPADAKAAAGTECRGSAGVCDVAETCDGSSNACPGDGFLSSSTVCRSAAGICDLAENCTGASAACPADAKASAGTECRASAGVCDIAEACDGTADACPGDRFQSSSTECRGAAGVCDLAESCTGASALCPSDGFVGLGTPCPNGNLCDGDETCDGIGACVASAPLSCDDSDPRTADSCAPTAGCSHLVCDDGNDCTQDAARGPSCVFTADDALTCPRPNATTACSGGACTITACNTGFANCTGGAADGCESDLTSPSTCGSCDDACTSGFLCLSGFCGGPLVAQDSLALGASHTCVRHVNGQVGCWGSNGSGELGNGTRGTSSTQVLVSGITDASWIAAGNSASCAVRGTGAVQCWGANTSGVLGNADADSVVPVTITGFPTAGNAPDKVSVGGGHACVVTRGGDVYCWGANAYGQLGNGTTSTGATPTIQHVLAPSGGGFLSGVDAIETAADFTCARRVSGTGMSRVSQVYCWGRNHLGQLGDGTNTDRNRPVLVTGAGNAVFRLSINGVGQHACVVTGGVNGPSGSVICWGYNDAGQLGDGTTANRSTPVTVASLTARAIVAGDHHTCVITNDAGRPMRCWGSNGSGQLGTSVGSPTNVTGLTGVTGIGAGGLHSCGLNGSLWCWGSNTSGQLGDGTTTSRATPVNVEGL